MEGEMQSKRPRRGIGATEEDLAREEGRINRIAWFGGVAVGIVTAATLAILLLVKAQHPWEFAVYPLLGGVPFAYGIFCNFVIRKMQVEALHRYQANLLFTLTDLQDKVYRDELTGLYNRRHFYEVIQAELDKAHTRKQPLAILLMDVDGLKRINDEYGHGVGDVVLANLGRLISRHIRNDDVASRLGGDEFGVIMPATDKRGAFALAGRLWEDLAQTPMGRDGDKHIMVSVSIGLAGFPWGGESLEEMIQWADADMYANKVSNRMAQETVPAQYRKEPDPGESYFEGE
ncbi:MAG: GGDEF domain-containing protein [Dehalococcoidia bacterium]|nr:GGDEF domain-containing protein [Dehalococcoidia bacterium]